MLQGSSGSSYRLVVRFQDRNVIFGAPPFSSYKQAVGHVSIAVRRHARDGDIAKVCLQRGVPLGASVERVSHWVTLEQWDGDVVQRILAQTPGPRNGQAAKRAVKTMLPPATTGSEHRAVRPGNGVLHPPRPPVKLPRPDPAQAAALAPIASPASLVAGEPVRKGHRWHVGVSLVLAVVAWLALAAVLADGRVWNMLGSTATAQPAEATELPFDAPPAEAAHPTAPASQPISLHAVH